MQEQSPCRTAALVSVIHAGQQVVQHDDYISLLRFTFRCEAFDCVWTGSESATGRKAEKVQFAAGQMCSGETEDLPESMSIFSDAVR